MVDRKLERKIDNIGYGVRNLSEKIPWTLNTLLLIVCIVLMVVNMVFLGMNNIILEDLLEKVDSRQLCLNVEMDCPLDMDCSDCTITVKECVNS